MRQYMNYFDLHCDTPYVMYRCNSKFDENTHHVSLKQSESVFSHYAQLAAYCASPRKSDSDGYEHYLKCTEYFKNELGRLSDRAMLCRNFSELEKAELENKAAVFLAVEDARILCSDLSRLDLLYDNGCRFLTLVWGGSSCVGGAHNTDVGLTEFGKSVSRKCFELGIIPDISHSSEKTVDDLLEIAQEANKPIIATHSNAFSVYSHTRNLRDRHFKALVELGGIVGISLCNIHIQAEGNADIDSVIRHIDHYLSLGGENNIAFGCDFDGCDLPEGVSSISDIPKIFERMSALGYSDELIAKISYQNSREFIKRNLTK